MSLFHDHFHVSTALQVKAFSVLYPYAVASIPGAIVPPPNRQYRRHLEYVFAPSKFQPFLGSYMSRMRLRLGSTLDPAGELIQRSPDSLAGAWGLAASSTRTPPLLSVFSLDFGPSCLRDV